MKPLLEANMTRNYGHKIKLYEHWLDLELGVLPYIVCRFVSNTWNHYL